MSNLLQDGTDWLAGQLQSFASKTVTCARGAQSCTALATIGKTIFKTFDGYGAEIRTESRDFLIPAAAYFPTGVQSEPVRGDQIRETTGATVFIYEVVAPGSEPHFRYSDASRKTLRIHTKLIQTV